MGLPAWVGRDFIAAPLGCLEIHEGPASQCNAVCTFAERSHMASQHKVLVFPFNMPGRRQNSAPSSWGVVQMDAAFSLKLFRMIFD